MYLFGKSSLLRFKMVRVRYVLQSFSCIRNHSKNYPPTKEHISIYRFTPSSLLMWHCLWYFTSYICWGQKFTGSYCKKKTALHMIALMIGLYNINQFFCRNLESLVLKSSSLVRRLITISALDLLILIVFMMIPGWQLCAAMMSWVQRWVEYVAN